MSYPITTRKLNRLQDRVEYCLEQYEEARNSDIDLFARLCERFYPPFERPLYNWRDLAGAMHQVPSLDHIARVRRKVIEKHKYAKYLPTMKGIALHRGISQKVWQDYARQHGIKDPAESASNIPFGYDDEGNHL